MNFPPVRERIRVRQTDPEAVQVLEQELSLPPAVAAALVARGLTSAGECRLFFRPSLEALHDPFLFVEMRPAVERVLRAVTKREKITIFGDYDVDGVTATALLVRFLQKLGAECDYYLPNRLTQGYGLSDESIVELAQRGTQLIITCDCGISAHAQAALAAARGIDLIITDHHEPQQGRPACCALIDPKVPGSGYPDTTLAGVGVALKLCQALAQSNELPAEYWQELLDLVAVGTAADIVPLRGENRIITYFGFRQIAASTNTGLVALIRERGLTGTEISTAHVVFQLAPCINAAGRLGDPRIGVELLLTADAARARDLARRLVEVNRERQALDAHVQHQAVAWVEQNCSSEHDFAIVAGDPSWHCGVIGIAASKVVERFYRPTILLSIGDEGLARGSGRSAAGVHLLQVLQQCGDLLESFGGHAAAAGLLIRTDQIPAFRRRFNAAVAALVSPDDLVPTVWADAEIDPAMINDRFFRIVNRMAPFGPGNRRPVFFSQGLTNRFAPRIVGQHHLKMTVGSNGTFMDAIAFHFGERFDEVRTARRFGLAFSVEENIWKGRVSLQMKVKGVAV